MTTGVDTWSRDESEYNPLHLQAIDLEVRELDLLKTIKRHESENKIEHFYRPNPPQEELLEAWLDWENKVFTYTGANRIGKTTILVILAISTIIGQFPWSRQKLKFPHKKPRKVRLIGQDWEKHIMQVLMPALKEWWPKNRPVKIKKNNVGAEAYWIDEMTGGSIEIMSNNQDSDLHEGWQGDLIGYDEPPKRDIRIANSRGLIDRDGRELFTMTLLKEAWVDKEVIKARLEDGTPDKSVYNVHGEIYDNVGYGLTAEGVENFRKKLKPEEEEARIYGKPSYMSSLVYPKYNRKTHVKTVKRIPSDWIVDIAIDFHPAKPWAVLFLATDPKNFKHCIDEIWENGSWKYICESILRRIVAGNYRVANIIIDPLAKGDKQSDLKEQSVFDKMQAFFFSYGYLMNGATKDKEGGIKIIDDLLMTDNEMPALFFSDRLVRTTTEIESWMRDDKGKPEKVDDDMMENLYRLGLLNTQYYEMDDEDDVEQEAVGAGYCP